MGDLELQYLYTGLAAVASFALGRFFSKKPSVHDNDSYAHGKTDAEAEAKARILEAETRGFIKGKEEGLAQGRKEGELEGSRKLAEEFLRGVQKGKDEVLADYEVRISPFCRSSKAGIGPWSSFELEIGYTHQLFVRSMPCLQPHETVIKKTSEKELDADKLVELTGKIVREAVASSNPVGISMKIAETVPLIKR